MASLTRRDFACRIGAGAGLASVASSATRTVAAAAAPSTDDRVVRMSADGIALSPAGYASLLAQLSGRREIVEDSYLLGGETEAFERHWASLLGKETAVFMPSGTLANQLALRALAGAKRRVIVPEVSHIYNDTGDACQTLSGLTLMPLAPGGATFTRADVEAVLSRTAGGRVATEVGAIAIETPIRRLTGQMFDWEEAQRITAFARERGIGTHLDGARLFIASAYTGITPAIEPAIRSTGIGGLRRRELHVDRFTRPDDPRAVDPERHVTREVEREAFAVVCEPSGLITCSLDIHPSVADGRRRKAEPPA